MTIAEWLATRTPPPPPELAARVLEALRPSLPRAAHELPEEALAAAEAILALLMKGGCAGRGHALDLLAVDALVTYAFEAASDAPDTLAARASDAMHRISSMTHAAHA